MPLDASYLGLGHLHYPRWEYMRVHFCDMDLHLPVFLAVYVRRHANARLISYLAILCPSLKSTALHSMPLGVL